MDILGGVVSEDKPKMAAKKKTDKQELPVGHDRNALINQTEADRARHDNVEVNPPEVEENNADWLNGREPTDVVEVEGQRETASARMARNGREGWNK